MNSRYELHGELGQGGAGTVFKAWDKRLSRFVAIKFLLPPEQRGNGSPCAEDLLAEASVLSSLQHPNVVSVFDVEQDAERGVCVVMEYLNGENLEQIIQRGPLTVPDFLEVAAQVLDGVNAAHRMGLQHRDLKPGNVMINWLADGKFQVKVLDFGLARFAARPSRQTSRNHGSEVLGSVHFMAPEQFRNRPIDQRADIYALGCLFYFALSARRPFEGESFTEIIDRHDAGKFTPLRQWKPQMVPVISEWVEWLMRREPDDRPRSVEQARDVLTQIRTGKITQLPAGLRGVATQSPRPPAPVRTITGKAGASAQPPAPGGHTKPVPKPQQKKKSKLPLIAGGLALAAGGIAAVILLAGGPDKTGAKTGKSGITSTGVPEKPGSGAPQAAAPATPGSLPRVSAPASTPPGDDLVLWFDASTGAFGPDGQSRAGTGTEVSLWTDLAAAGGKAAFQYLKGGARDRGSVVPLLEAHRAPQLAGGTAPVIRFSGGQNLVLRDKDHIGDALADALDGPGVTAGLSFSAGGEIQAQQCLLAASSADKTIWEVCLENGSIYAGSGGVRTEALPVTPGLFHSAVASFDWRKGTARLVLASSVGVRTATAEKLKKPAGLQQLRLGSSRKGAGTAAFRGDISTIVVYSDALSSKAAADSATWMHARLHGRPPPGGLTAGAK